MTPERLRRVRQVLDRRQPDLTVFAEDVYKPHNLSAILRSCDAVGVGTVHAVRPTGGVPTYSATSASAEKWVELRVHPSLDDVVSELRAGGMQLLAAHFGPAAVDYRDVDYTRPTCLLLGNERSGVTSEAAAAADGHVTIPMLGMVRSLNVSVAAAVLLFEAQRQRRAAGLYDQPRLDPRRRNELALRWLHPRAARELEERGLPFPELLPNGQLPEATVSQLTVRDGASDDAGA